MCSAPGPVIGIVSMLGPAEGCTGVAMRMPSCVNLLLCALPGPASYGKLLGAAWDSTTNRLLQHHGSQHHV